MFEYARYEYALASAQLVFAMLGMGALLTPKDFGEIIRSPRALSVGLALQLVAVPLVAVAIGALFPIEAGIAAGLVLVAAVPGGTMSNIVTYLARGSIALSIALTGITTVGALVVTPLLMRLLISASLPDDFEMPVGRVAYEIGVTLLLPLASGMLFGMRFPDWRERFSRWSIRASLGVIVVIVIGAGTAGRLDFSAYGPAALLSVLALAVGAQAVAFVTSLLLRIQPAERVAILIEVTIRNANLALLVKASVFPAVAGTLDPIGDGMFFVALLYGGVAMLIAAPAAIAHRRRYPGASDS